MLASITKSCSQVKEIHTLKSAEEKLLWLFLISDEFCLEHLQLITTSKQNFRTKLPSRLYSQFADKFKDTLDMLKLNLHRFNDNRDIQFEYHFLLRSFKSFKSLKDLYFINCVTASIQDEIIHLIIIILKSNSIPQLNVYVCAIVIQTYMIVLNILQISKI